MHEGKAKPQSSISSKKFRLNPELLSPNYLQHSVRQLTQAPNPLGSIGQVSLSNLPVARNLLAHLPRIVIPYVGCAIVSGTLP